MLGVREEKDEKDTVLFQKSIQSCVRDKGLQESHECFGGRAQRKGTVLILGTLQKLPGGSAF